jgi:hypothetical protein
MVTGGYGLAGDTMACMEIREIPGHPSYFATDDGRILSRRRGTERFLKPHVQRKVLAGGTEYARHQVMLGRDAHAYVHQLVCAAFHGPRPSDLHEVAHLDGDATNNRPGNLAWKTKIENQLDRIEHGTSNRGSQHGLHKLTEANVTEMRRLRREGWLQHQLADRYGVNQTTISDALTGRRWGWLKDG